MISSRECRAGLCGQGISVVVVAGVALPPSSTLTVKGDRAEQRRSPIFNLLILASKTLKCSRIVSFSVCGYVGRGDPVVFPETTKS
jgi:hypothetical protein